MSSAVVTFLYLLESYWFDNLGIFTEGNLLLRYISPSTWGNQRGVRDPHHIKLISGAVAGDSSLQDRGVAHYLLSLLFSRVSLPFSFYFCVLNQKYQKYLLLLWVPLKTQSCVISLVTTTMTLYALLLLHLPLQHSYEIKPALLSLVMKDQFSGAGEDA